MKLVVKLFSDVVVVDLECTFKIRNKKMFNVKQLNVSFLQRDI